jgi:predicted nucleic acid-binding protein
MQTVISNSTPIIHLAKIGQLDLLHRFFGTIIVPQMVWKECTSPGEKRAEIADILAVDWIQVVRINDRIVTLLRHELDHGEAEAIALALERKATLLLLDDSDAREKARLYHLPITGTVGLLLRAYREGMLDSLAETLDELESSGFRLHSMLKQNLLKEAGEL